MKILHLEDNREDAVLIADVLLSEWPDCRIEIASTRPTFLDLVRKPGFDIILSDFTLHSFNGLEALALARQLAPDVPFIFLSGTIGEERAIEAVQAGAADYVIKDRMQRLLTAIKRALRESHERRKSRAAEEARQRFVAILESTPDFVAMTEPAGRVLYINRAGLRMLGLPEDQDISRLSMRGFHPPEIAEFITGAAVHEALRDSTWSGETALLTREGARVPVSQVIIAHKGPDGSVDYLSTIMRDLTRAKDADRRIREQTEIINKAREAILIVGLDDRFAYWNEGAERLFGWKRDEVVGKRPEDIFPAFVCEQVRIIREAARAVGEWSGEMRMVTKDQRQIAVENRVTLVRDDAGQPRARLNIINDITARKQMEERLLRAQRLESIGMLAAGIAHDLNNVLAPILMAAPMLRERATHPTDIKMIGSLEKSAERGAGLVRQILSFAHGTGGEHRVVQVKHLVHDIGNVITQTFPKNIRFDSNCPNDLWPINANPTQVHQVLLNLCVNARDAMALGGTLTVRAENCSLTEKTSQAIVNGRPGAFLVLSVQDTGTGISPEILEHMWEPFFTTKEADKGTGLGLSTVRGIIENHNGFLTIETATNRGTTFRAYFPAAEGAVSHEPAPPGTRTPFGGGELILVVDDEVGVRDLTTTILMRHGYRVLVANDGTEAIALFAPRSQEIRLVVTDVNMPNLDGAGLISVIRRLNPATKILVVSGMARKDKATGTSPSVSAFLMKPFTIEALLKSVSQLLASTAEDKAGSKLIG